MRLPIVAAAATLALSLTLTSLAESSLWVDHFDKAKQTAAAGKKDLLMDFTGSDWCSWCIKLRKEVFDLDTFKKAAPKDFVLVELDYPQDDSKLTAEVKAQNALLQQEFAIRGYPTIVLADSTGRPYAETGYQAGGPEKYLEHLSTLRAIKTKRDEAFARAASATGVEKAMQLAAGLKVMEEDVVARHYMQEMDEITRLDPKDQAGLGPIRFKGELASLQTVLVKTAKADGVGGVRKGVDEFIAAHPKISPEQRQTVLFGLLGFYRPPQDNETVLKLMAEVKGLKSDSEMGKQAEAIEGRVRQMMAQAEAEKSGTKAK